MYKDEVMSEYPLINYKKPYFRAVLKDYAGHIRPI